MRPFLSSSFVRSTITYALPTISLSRERFSNLNPSFLSLQRNKEPHLFHQRLHGGESIHDVMIDDEPGRILFLLVLFLTLPHGPIYRLAHPLATYRCKAPRSNPLIIYLDRNTCCGLHLHSDTTKNHRLLSTIKTIQSVN